MFLLIIYKIIYYERTKNSHNSKLWRSKSNWTRRWMAKAKAGSLLRQTVLTGKCNKRKLRESSHWYPIVRVRKQLCGENWNFPDATTRSDVFSVCRLIDDEEVIGANFATAEITPICVRRSHQSFQLLCLLSWCC